MPARTVPTRVLRHARAPAEPVDVVETRLTCSLVPGTGRKADPWILLPVPGQRVQVTGCTRDEQTAWFVILVQGGTPPGSATAAGAVRVVQSVADGPVTARFVDSLGRRVDAAVWGDALHSGRAVPLASLGYGAVGIRFGLETTSAGFGVELDLRR